MTNLKSFERNWKCIVWNVSFISIQYGSQHSRWVFPILWTPFVGSGGLFVCFLSEEQVFKPFLNLINFIVADSDAFLFLLPLEIEEVHYFINQHRLINLNSGSVSQLWILQINSKEVFDLYFLYLFGLFVFFSLTSMK